MRRIGRADVPFATEPLARYLIGLLLVRRFDDAAIAAGRIVETEAYTADDPASHSFRGPTNRNRTMFGPAFHAYVYFIYGTAHCLNVTSDMPGVGAAVLIRALEPIYNVPAMRARRGAAIADRDLLRGPGRLCAAFDIDRRCDGADFDTDARLWIATDGAPLPAVGTSTRIGITKAADTVHRYYARGSRFLSGSARLSPDA